MYKVIIVEDELLARNFLAGMFEESFKDYKVIAKCASVAEAKEAISKEKPDLLMLDIEMPQGNGFDLLNQLEEINFHIVFTTAYDHYALKAIKFAALDYLLKPIDEDELQQTLKKFEALQVNQSGVEGQLNELLQSIQSNSKQERIALPSDTGIDFVKISDIVRCESDNNYTRIFTINKEVYLVSKPLKEYEGLLSDHDFIRVHQSHLINFKMLKRYSKEDGGSVELFDGSVIVISRRKKSVIEEAIGQLSV